MLDATGTTYGVLVQVSVHGTDNSLLVEALRAHPGRLRGVAVTPPDISDRALAELKDAGVTGLRLNTVTGVASASTGSTASSRCARNWAGTCSS